MTAGLWLESMLFHSTNMPVLIACINQPFAFFEKYILSGFKQTAVRL